MHKIKQSERITSLVACFEGLDPFGEGFGSFDVGIIPDRSSSVAEELLVDSLEGSVFLPAGLLDTILMVLVVLILRGVILVL